MCADVVLVTVQLTFACQSEVCDPSDVLLADDIQIEEALSRVSLSPVASGMLKQHFKVIRCCASFAAARLERWS